MKSLEKSITKNINIKDELDLLQNKCLECDDNISFCNNKIDVLQIIMMMIILKFY